MKLRSYQQDLVTLSGAMPGNVLIQADTGSGKTPVLAKIAQDHDYVLCIAHRNLLIKQLSRVLAKFQIHHQVIASNHTRRLCIAEHRRLGGQWIGGKNKWVCSIDSLLSRYRRGLLSLDLNAEWLILVDEAHHMTDENKWGQLATIFPNARIVGATATPCRLDQVSLARGHGGVFDSLIQAEELKQDSVKKLIELGFVSDFKCYSLPERIDASKLKLGRTDYTYQSLSSETGRVCYEMAGDAVKHYQRLAKGKQALAFCVDIEIAKLTAQKFKDAGIASAAIHSKLGSAEVARIFDLFERRLIQVLCNVDMIGEGVDVPAIEALIMLRKTASFGLFRQWCGRSLRPEPGKDHAILIDHVGNILTHGMPDKHIDWDLFNPPQAVKSNLIPCPDCRFIFAAWLLECPECGHVLQRSALSSGGKSVQYLDVGLVLLQRKMLEQQRANETTLLIAEHPQRLAQGALGDGIEKIRLWFADNLRDRLSYAELNQFFAATANKDFWIERFRLRDAEHPNFEKCWEVYQQWQK